MRVTRDRGQGMTEFSLKAIQLQAVMINTFNLMPGSVDIERNLVFRWILLRDLCLFSEDAKLLRPWRIGDEDNRTNYGEDRFPLRRW